MTEPQAKALVAKLLAAFPHPKVEALTVRVYVQALQKLLLPAAALDAVDRLIASQRFLPKVAEVYDEYHSVKDRHQPAGLPEPAMTEEQIKENLARCNEMIERFSRPVDSGAGVMVAAGTPASSAGTPKRTPWRAHEPGD